MFGGACALTSNRFAVLKAKSFFYIKILLDCHVKAKCGAVVECKARILGDSMVRALPVLLPFATDEALLT